MVLRHPRIVGPDAPTTLPTSLTPDVARGAAAAQTQGGSGERARGEGALWVPPPQGSVLGAHLRHRTRGEGSTREPHELPQEPRHPHSCARAPGRARRPPAAGSEQRGEHASGTRSDETQTGPRRASRSSHACRATPVGGPSPGTLPPRLPGSAGSAPPREGPAHSGGGLRSPGRDGWGSSPAPVAVSSLFPPGPQFLHCQGQGVGLNGPQAPFHDGHLRLLPPGEDLGSRRGLSSAPGWMKPESGRRHR